MRWEYSYTIACIVVPCDELARWEAKGFIYQSYFYTFWFRSFWPSAVDYSVYTKCALCNFFSIPWSQENMKPMKYWLAPKMSFQKRWKNQSWCLNCYFPPGFTIARNNGAWIAPAEIVEWRIAKMLVGKKSKERVYFYTPELQKCGFESCD